LVTDQVTEAIRDRESLLFDPIGEVNLKGFPTPTPLFLVRAAG
jgi:class 3 adenylate cyclase